MSTLNIILIVLLVLAPSASFVLGAMLVAGRAEDELNEAWHAGYGQALEDEGPSNDTLLAVGLAMDPETADAIATAYNASLLARLDAMEEGN